MISSNDASGTGVGDEDALSEADTATSGISLSTMSGKPLASIWLSNEFSEIMLNSESTTKEAAATSSSSVSSAVPGQAAAASAINTVSGAGGDDNEETIGAAATTSNYQRMSSMVSSTPNQQASKLADLAAYHPPSIPSQNANISLCF